MFATFLTLPDLAEVTGSKFVVEFYRLFVDFKLFEWNSFGHLRTWVDQLTA